MNVTDCEELRREIKAIAERLWWLRSDALATHQELPDEAYANATIAYRHLEDASMRLGKAIQAFDGGTSVYDKSQVPEVATDG